MDIEYWGSFIHYYITSRKIDILFISNSYFGYYLIPWLRKEFPDISIIDYVHMEEWYWRAGGYARTSGAFGDFIEKTYVCNDHLRHVMIESFDKKDHEVETVYIGVDEEEFNPDYTKEGHIRVDLNISQDQPLILFPCRLHPQKRPFLMVEIVKRLKVLLPDVIVVVVGDGPQWDELLTVIKKEKLQHSIYCVGRKDDMRPYYRDSQVTLVCSLKEGLSLTAYESLAMGVPVVTSDVGGQKELINNEVGRVIPLYQSEEADLDNRHFMKKEVDEYVAALFDILSMAKADKEKMGKQCRERIEQDFTKTNMVRFFEEEFTAWKYQRSKEENKRMSEYLKTFPRLIDDYISLYIEYEITAISSN
ncbi:glycosyltransferase family 4 protein, partial [Paenibacillus jamilae]|uniref:glycosyltransferase family 4 protein n=1 Tax=Paenibacillus jamilae TaxID=114136 RepID=UPI0014289530